jgi:hypothetical protein
LGTTGARLASAVPLPLPPLLLLVLLLPLLLPKVNAGWRLPDRTSSSTM